MNLNEKITQLRLAFSKYECKPIFDTDKDGEEFCELIISNPYKDGLPIILTLDDSACTLRLGMTEIETVDGDDLKYICEQTQNIMDDKVIIMTGYASEEDMDDEKSSYSIIFNLALGEIVERAYKKTLATLEKPLNPFTRIFAYYKGIFVFNSFTGKNDRVITRK